MREYEKNYGYGRNVYVNRYTSKNSLLKGSKGIDKKKIDKIANQAIVSGVIAFLIIVLSNFNNPFIDKTISGVKWILNTNCDFQETFYNIRDNFIPNMSNKLKNISDEVENIFGKTQPVNSSNIISNVNTAVMLMPISGNITSGYGMREHPVTHENVEHKGIDIAGQKGTPIKAVLDGIVIKIEENESLGRVVRLKHSSGLETLYAHCSEIMVDENQQVKQGDYIAKVGDTGVTTGPHLHFEVFKDGVQINPMDVLNSIIEIKE